MAAADRWLVVGLGNPGPEYEATRHNAGRRVVELLAGRTGASLKRHKARAAVAETRLDGVPVVLAAPSSYMNESGGPVRSLVDFFKVPPGRVVAVHDELDLPLGTLRTKLGGGDGGHNGLRSMRRSLGTGDFLRVRVGIGRPPGRQDPADYVLKPFATAERKELGVVLETAADLATELLTDDLETVQNRYHAT